MDTEMIENEIPEENRPKKEEKKKDRMPLRSINDLVHAHEWLWNQQKDGQIDSKTADALNTTLKGAVYLNGRLKLDMVKLMVAAQIKKIELPPGLLPE